MIQVSDIESDVKRALGGVSDTEFYARLNHAVEILSTESEWDPLLGYVDVCACSDRYVTLPSIVGTVLSVTIDGTPTQGHDRWWKFHLNGPGQRFHPVGYHWVDGFPVCTQADPPAAAARICAVLESGADAGKVVRVFGYDVNGNWIRSSESGAFVDGFKVPTVFGSTAPNASAPPIRTITRVQKEVTAGTVKLFTVNDSNVPQRRLSEYMPHEKEPSYRRIQLSRACAWARIAFRKAQPKLTQPTDLIFLHSPYAVVLMCKALKKLDDDRIEEAEAYQNKAVQLLVKKQYSLDVPGGPSVQIANNNLIADRSDRLE